MSKISSLVAKLCIGEVQGAVTSPERLLNSLKPRNFNGPLGELDSDRLAGVIWQS